MAKVGKSGIFPTFTSRQIREVIDEKAREFDEKAFKALQYVGEQFVNDARTNGNYTDRTGNLRGSIGYVILVNGVIRKSNFTGKPEGRKKAREFAGELASEFGKGLVLIGVAGMSYAAAVEAKGYDVITSSVPTGDILKRILNGINL